jgi:hypothetical protein
MCAIEDIDEISNAEIDLKELGYSDEVIRRAIRDQGRFS